MRVYLKYDSKGNHAITSLNRVSKPGRRVYVKSAQIPTVRSGLGMCVLSTSQGILSGKDAIEKSLGGELLCKVW
jgi:small subunit ribosomal protein S8